MGSHPAHLHNPARLEKPVVRLIVTITALYSVATWAMVAVTGKPALQVHAVTSAITAMIGTTQIVMKREHTYSLVMITAAAITLNVSVGDALLTFASSLVALLVIGIGATLFARRPRLHIAGYAVWLFGAIWLWHDGDSFDGAFEGITIAAVFAFGAGLIEWIRTQADLSAAGYEHLFRHAPVSLWREDYSQVHGWLTLLRSTGVTDLAAYLDANPQRIEEAAGLIAVTEVNDAALQLLEADHRSDLVGRLDPSGVSESSRDSIRDQLIGVWNGESHIVTEIRNGRTLKGSRLEGLLSFTVPEIDGQPDYSQATVAIVDVTESRRARQQLEELIASKDQLVAAVSHELRTPLTAVVGLAGELADNFDEFSAPEVEEFIRMIASQSEDVSLIVDDLLVAAQAESGTIHHRPEPTDVGEQITLALDGIRSVEGVELEIADPPVTATTDPGRLRQIIRNLVTNADRYGTPPIRITVSATEDEVRVEVRDCGDALPPEQRNDIFNRYHRAKERPGVAASVGVGLTVSRELARVMGGDLTYDHDGETVFTLTMPPARDEADRLAV